MHKRALTGFFVVPHRIILLLWRKLMMISDGMQVRTIAPIDASALTSCSREPEH